eukprot:CAMPEP_0184293370 /NCGR_PEP_ID=MMETSP1049-20130417/4819_1 /TAXON_ID=77928 /ORGANISM="Proteomonas sulcata, Strain CCMP704" /LENGTH=566 /DNA_ID=CAMNT_0026601333 /DNA_START=39 /DNA_END=1739 /DNA_ORIENTATION=-
MKLKAQKKVLLLLVKDKNGSNFSAYTTDMFPGGDVAKIGMPPCHKSKRSPEFWRGLANPKEHLMFKDRKPGEHSIQEMMEALFRLTGVSISMKSSDIKAVVPSIIAMLRLKLPEIPQQRLSLSKNMKVDDDFHKLKDLLQKLGPQLVEALPLLRLKFGVGSVEDLSGLQPSQFSEPLQVDKGKIVMMDKNFQYILIDNGVTYCDNDTQMRIARKLRVLGLEKFIPEAMEPWTRKIETAGIKPCTEASVEGKKITIGDEDRTVVSHSNCLAMRTETEAGFASFLEITDEFLAKYRDKKGEKEILEGRPCLFGRLTFDNPLTRDNVLCDAKGHIKDWTNAKDAAEYIVEAFLAPEDVARIQKATQTALGVSAGGVSLAQNYGNLFEHRMKSAEDVTELNNELMQAIKAQDVKKVLSLLKRGASANFKDETGWSPLQRACSARVDTGDLGMNFIATNQIVEVLIKAGADVSQTNNYGRTALHYASMEGNFYAASVLVHAGAPVDAKDNTVVPDPLGEGVMTGANAAFHAKLMKKNEWSKIVSLLELYSDEPPPPPVETKKKGKKGKKKK